MQTRLTPIPGRNYLHPWALPDVRRWPYGSYLTLAFTNNGSTMNSLNTGELLLRMEEHQRQLSPSLYHAGLPPP